MTSTYVKISCIIISLFFLFNCSTHTIQNYPASKNNKHINKGLIAAVQQNDEWFFINENNEKLFDQTFTFASEFHDKISCVSKAVKGEVYPSNFLAYYAIHTNGNKIGKIQSDLPFMFREERAVITKGDSAFLIDTQGKILKTMLKPKFFIAYNDGRAISLMGKNLQIWDRNGNVINENLSLSFREPSEGYIAFKKNGKCGYTDKNGYIVQEAIYADTYNFRDGLARVIDTAGNTFFINQKFEKVLGPFQDAHGMREGIITVKQGDLWQFINQDGKLIIDEKYSEAAGFHEGFAIVIKQDKTLGFINKKGNFTPIDAKIAFSFKNGHAVAEKNHKLGFINTKGEWVIPAQYDRVNNFNLIK